MTDPHYSSFRDQGVQRFIQYTFGTVLAWTNLTSFFHLVRSDPAKTKGSIRRTPSPRDCPLFPYRWRSRDRDLRPLFPFVTPLTDYRTTGTGCAASTSDSPGYRSFGSRVPDREHLWSYLPLNSLGHSGEGDVGRRSTQRPDFGSLPDVYLVRPIKVSTVPSPKDRVPVRSVRTLSLSCPFPNKFP